MLFGGIRGVLTPSLVQNKSELTPGHSVKNPTFRNGNRPRRVIFENLLFLFICKVVLNKGYPMHIWVSVEVAWSSRCIVLKIGHFLAFLTCAISPSHGLRTPIERLQSIFDRYGRLNSCWMRNRKLYKSDIECV